MAYNVVLRRNGAKVGHFGPFGTKKQAIAQGQVLADDSARDVVVSVEPQRKKATTKKKRTNTRRKRKNGPTLVALNRTGIQPELTGISTTTTLLLKRFKSVNVPRSAIPVAVRSSRRLTIITPSRVASSLAATAPGTRKAALKKASGQKSNVKTARQAQKYLGGRSLTSSASWHNQPRKNPARTRSNPASKSILKRIDLANKWIAFAQKHDIRGIDTSSTWHSSLTYTHKIAVSAAKNRATMKYTEDFAPGKKQSETYNLNDTDTYSDTGVSALRYAINTYIIKPIKRGAKDEGVTIPASLR